MNHARDPLTSKGSIERIALLPLNYTRYNTIIVYNRIFCRTRESVKSVIIMKMEVLTCFVRPPHEMKTKGQISFLDFVFAEGILTDTSRQNDFIHHTKMHCAKIHGSSPFFRYVTRKQKKE